MRRYRRAVSAALTAVGLAAGMLAGAGVASATTGTFTATEDTFVHGGNPTAVQGALAFLRVDDGYPKIAYVKFSPTVPAGEAVSDVHLRLWGNAINQPVVPVDIYAVDPAAWSEATTNFNNRPTLGAKLASGTVVVGGWMDVTLPAASVPGSGPVSFAIVRPGTGNDSEFASREATNKPTLVVTSAPVADTTAPTVPTGLTATPSAPGATPQVVLAWNASTDNVGVTGYTVKRDGTALPDVTGTTLTDTAVTKGSTYSYTVEAFDAAGNRSAPSAAVSATVPNDPPPPPPPPPSSGLAISAAEVANLPMSGSAWTNVKTRADATWPAPNLNDQDNILANYVWAGALVYARTGDAAYKTKVVNAIASWARGGPVDSLALFRFTGTMVRSADLAGMDRATVVASGETWQQWTTRIMNDPVGDHSTWNAISTTARIAPNNYGSYARDAMAALAIYNNLATEKQQVYDYTARWLGDLSKPNPFPHPTDSAILEHWYCATGFDPNAPEHYLAVQGVVNPPNGQGGCDAGRAGANAEDAARGGPPPTAIDKGINYQLGSEDGTISAAIMLHRAGLGDLFETGSQAIRRNIEKVNTDQSAATWAALFRSHTWVINKRYGTNLPTQPVSTGRALGYADWLTGAGSGWQL